jgi:hypothetical protein
VTKYNIIATIGIGFKNCNILNKFSSENPEVSRYDVSQNPKSEHLPFSAGRTKSEPRCFDVFTILTFSHLLKIEHFNKKDPLKWEFEFIFLMGPP